MNLFQFGRLIYRNLTALVSIPLFLSILIFVFTINQEKEYASSALVYTGIASGFDIESGSSDKVDYHAVNNAFDNLLSLIESKQTMEEVLLKLLAHHLNALENGNEIPLRYKSFLDSSMPSKELSVLYNSNGEESTYQNLKLGLENNNPLLINLIRGENDLYTTKLMKNLEAKRHKSSDMLKLYFTAKDPHTSKLVLELVIEVFSNKYKAIKVAETGDVVAYFKRQLDKAQEKLNMAEDKLTSFRTGARVINYGEQTKAIAIKKQNALEEYSNKKINLLATKATLKELEDKLQIRQDLLTKNNEILDKKNRLAILIQELPHTEGAPNSPGASMEINEEIESLKLGIKKDMETIFSFSNSKEGLPNRQLLNEWLENLITLNKDQVTVDYYKNRLDELDAMYENFAPLGSTLARLEREISVAEREYLEILNSLNMSKLRQQNIELSSQLEIVDWPQLPTKAQSTKRKLLIIAGFLFGLFSVIGFLVAREMLDSTLSSPAKAEKITNLELVGAFPVINEQLKKKHPHLLDKVKSLTTTKLLSKGTDPTLTIIFSLNESEGKTVICKNLADEISESGFNVNLLLPEGTEVDGPFNKQYYTVNSKLNQVKSIEELGVETLEGYTILVLPPLNSGKIPFNLISRYDNSIMVTRADRTWNLAQSKTVKNWKKNTGNKPFLVLNGVKTYHLEEFVGDIGSRHNKLVEVLRKVAKFEFGSAAFRLF